MLGRAGSLEGVRHPGGIRWRPTAQPVGGPGTCDSSAVSEGKLSSGCASWEIRWLAMTAASWWFVDLQFCLRIAWEKSQLAGCRFGAVGGLEAARFLASGWSRDLESLPLDLGRPFCACAGGGSRLGAP